VDNRLRFVVLGRADGGHGQCDESKDLCRRGANGCVEGDSLQVMSVFVTNTL
jgi:hypothetical protein